LLRFLFMALLCLVSSGLWSGTTMVSHSIECWVFSTHASTLNARYFYFPVSLVIELFVSGNSFGELAQQVVKLLHGIEDLDCWRNKVGSLDFDLDNSFAPKTANWEYEPWLYRLVMMVLGSKKWPDWYDLMQYQSCTRTCLLGTWGNTSLIPEQYQSQHQVYTCHTTAKNQPWTLILGQGWYEG
jgi:hypothetical protein